MGAPSGPGEVYDYVYRFLWDTRRHTGLWRLGEEGIRRIARAEAARVAPLYEAIGGSPLVESLRWLAGEAAGAAGAEAVVGFCYARPLLEDLDVDGGFAVVPLYPVYSAATTGRCFKKAEALWGPVARVEEWWREPGYLEWVSAGLRRGVEESGFDEPHVLFTVHSIPRRLVEAGDPYLSSYLGIAERVAGGLGLRYTVAFQSIHGKRGWLGPGVEETLERLAGEGVGEVVVYPLSFVAENFETLYELDVEARGAAERLGVSFYRVRLRHRDPRLVEALAAAARRACRSL